MAVAACAWYSPWEVTCRMLSSRRCSKQPFRPISQTGNRFYSLGANRAENLLQQLGRARHGVFANQFFLFRDLQKQAVQCLARNVIVEIWCLYAEKILGESAESSESA